MAAKVPPAVRKSQISRWAAAVLVLSYSYENFYASGKAITKSLSAACKDILSKIQNNLIFLRKQPNINPLMKQQTLWNSKHYSFYPCTFNVYTLFLILAGIQLEKELYVIGYWDRYSKLLGIIEERTRQSRVPLIPLQSSNGRQIEGICWHLQRETHNLLHICK